MAENEFMFLISTFVPKGASGPRRTEMLTSQRRDPSCMLPSLTPRYRMIRRISEAYSAASRPVRRSGLLTISAKATPARL